MGKKREYKYLRRQEEAKKEILKTILLFLVLCFILNFAYFFFFKEQIHQRSFTASLVAFLLNLFGLPAKANGTFVLMNDASIDIIGECTGIFSIIVYCSVIFAYPTDIKKKAIGMIGIPILYGITLIRLISTVLIGLFIPSLIDFFHDYLWQVFLIVFVVLLFLIWRDRIVEVKEK